MGTVLYVAKIGLGFVSVWASLVAQTEESSCNAGDLGSIPGLGRSPGRGPGNPLQYSFLGEWPILDYFFNKALQMEECVYPN